MISELSAPPGGGCPRCRKSDHTIYHGHELGQSGCDTWCSSCGIWYNDPALQTARDARSRLAAEIRRTWFQWRKRRRLKEQLLAVDRCIAGMIR